MDLSGPDDAQFPCRRDLGRRRTVVVTDAGLAQGVAVTRSLARAGWRVVAVDSSPFSPAFVSRHVAARHLAPAAEQAPDRAADELVRITRAQQADLVVPVTDQALFSLLDRVDDLPDHTVLAAADPRALQVARSKDETLALAERVGVPVPPWRLGRSADEVRRFAAELGWPIVCKPLMSHAPTAAGPVATQAVTFARSPEQLDEQLVDGRVDPPVLVQRYVAGTGLGIDLLCHEGRVLAAFQHRRLREVPTWGGMSSSRVSEPLDPRLLRFARALLEPLAWSGVAMVEFRSTPAGPVLMEINGRVWGSMALPVRAGMDFPARLAAQCVRNGPASTGPLDQHYRVGVECRNVGLELRWAIQTLKRSATPSGAAGATRRDALRVLTGLLDPRHEFDVQVLEDPLPGVWDAARAIAEPLGTAIARAGARLRAPRSGR